ncbi:MAG: crotonase/enoyl-CoA hydratase family protein [Solirubrobacterales bacterium]|nr:crotonase/enoyl-CoA hydratase family protein [Solirubrobacterales bacterium]
MNDQPAVLTERRDGVLVVTLNRPDQRNAVNGALAEGVGRAMDELDDDPELRVGVLFGAGKGFSAGMDLKAFVRGESPYYGDRGFAGLCQGPPAKPLIAAVEGFALAGGLEIALACDLIVAAEGARLGIPEVKRGLAAASGGLVLLPRRIPFHLAMELALTGDPIDAQRAAAIGLVNQVTPVGGALEAALALAGRITPNGPLAVIASKRVIVEQQDWSLEEIWAKQGEITSSVNSSEDAREGATAFAEKRAPVWKGR